MQRREAVSVILAGLTAPFIIAADRPASDGLAQPDFAGIERQVSGRLGVCVIDLASHRSIGYRAGERFPMCSTFKLLLAGQILSMIDSGREQLSHLLPYTKADLLDYAPVTRAHVGEGGMTVSALLAAALQYSDNTAANLLLRVVGGPPAVTSYVRDLGDGVTRLDRTEPDLNTAVPGDARDTTTPNAMAGNLQALLVGNALTPKSRDLLNTWLLGNTTGVGKLRAGLPKDWRVGDKTGSGAYGTTNDVAIVWPASKQPLLMTAFITESTVTPSDRDAALAAIGRAAAAWAADIDHIDSQR